MALFGIIAVGFALIVVYAIVRAFQAQITFVFGAIVLSFCAYGVFKAFKNYAAAFKKNAIDSNRS